MAHSQQGDSCSQEKASCACVVSHLSDLSPTVKQVVLNVKMCNDISFKPGQWVDFFIPGISTITGFSMCSSPKTLQEKHTMDLAVKKSDYPPTAWVHNKCRVGSEVVIRVGRDFFLDQKDTERPILLLAGGVGINPLLSMLFHVSETRKPANPPAPVVLMYSTKTQDEMIFVDQIQAVIENNPWIHLKRFVTQENIENKKQEGLSYQRIDASAITQCLDSHFSGCKDSLVSFLCGPSPFIDSMEEYLIKAGIGKDCILYEKWW